MNTNDHRWVMHVYGTGDNEHSAAWHTSNDALFIRMYGAPTARQRECTAAELREIAEEQERFGNEEQARLAREQLEAVRDQV